MPRESQQRDSGRSRQRGFLARVRRIEKSITQDSWLPLGLRTLLVSELPEIRQSLEQGRIHGRAQTAQRVHELAMLSFQYGSEVLDSEAVTQLRVLDLEMNPLPHASRDLGDWKRTVDDEDARSLFTN